jgi:hypothetical protein
MNNLILSNNYNRETPPPPENNKKQKNKIDLKKIKNNTFNSLNEVEGFLNDFQRFKKYIKLYKILK